MSSNRILVIGSSNFDLTVYCERLPGPGETVLGGRFSSGIGGKGANQATAASRMGGDVTFFSAVGHDSYGEAIREHFSSEKVHSIWADAPAGVATGVALILVDQRGQNSIAVAAGANACIASEALDGLHFPDFSHVLLSLEIPLEAVSRAATLAKRAGCCVLLNPAPATLLPEELLKNVDILLPNEHEIHLLDAQKADSHEECAARLFSYGVNSLVITLGAEGAKVIDQTGTRMVPGFPTEAVDTVGAGDCFCGSLTTFLAEGLEISDAVRLANKAASLSVQHAGAISSFPHRHEVLEKHPHEHALSS